MSDSTYLLIVFLVAVAVAAIGCGWAVKRRENMWIEIAVCLAAVAILGALLYPTYSFQKNREAASWRRKHPHIQQVQE